MNSPQLQRYVLAALVLWPALAQAETTLGRSQGIALIGRSLEVSVPVTLDPGTDPSTLCVDADVFYADSRVGASRVNARVEPGGIGSATLRITASQPIDEPVVTVYVRFGCRDKQTRRYVLLSEQPGDAGLEPVAPVTRPGARAGSPVAGPAAAAGPRPGGASRPGPAAAATPTPDAARPAGERLRARAPAAAPVQPRLKLEAPDLSLVPDTGLRLSGTLSETTDAASQRRAEAAADWQSLNIRSEDVLLTARRLQALESDMKLLREALLKDKTSIATLRGELDRAQGERYANPLVYGLGVLLVAALAAVVWLSRRTVRPAEPDRDWWRGRGATPETDFDGADAPSTLRVQSRPADVEDTDGSGLDLSFTQSTLDRLQTPGLPAWHGAGGGAGEVNAGSRAVNAEELSDIQQQADFFVSLGEYEQAIDVLRGHIQAYPEASALTWLDLLDLHHKLQRRGEYEQIRAEFQRTFNAQVPSFEAYREQSAGLEDYPSALSRISALWPSPKVLDVIEDSIFRKPADGHGEAFGLEAYRELLLLHHIGKEVIEASRGATDDFLPSSQHPPDFSNTSIQPLSAALGTHPGFMPSTFELSRIGLDINLDDPGVEGSRPGLRSGSTSGFGAGQMLDFDLTGTELTDLPARNPS